MFRKFVKDRAHNRYEAYCCEDIDARLAPIEEALEALVAGTVPDGSVTLAKLAEDARSWAREINRGTLICEWIGTQEEYDEHVEENGGEPLANCRYTITDNGFELFALGSFVTVRAAAGYTIGDERALYVAIDSSTGEPTKGYAETASGTGYRRLSGTWRCCGVTAVVDDYNYMIYQRIA